MYTWVQTSPITAWQPEDTPTGSLRVELTIHGTELHYGSRSLVLAYIDGATYLKRYVGEHGEHGNRLALIATATPPQEYDLPLVDGCSNANMESKSRYSKDQFGRVLVDFAISGDIKAYEHTQIAILPIGYRPPAVVHTIGYNYNVLPLATVVVWVRRDGCLYCHSSETLSAVAGQIIFDCYEQSN